MIGLKSFIWHRLRIQKKETNDSMMKSILNILEFNSIFGQESDIQVLILHRANSGFFMMINCATERLEDKFREDLVKFYSADVQNPKIQMLINVFRIKEIPASLFYRKGCFKTKIEGMFTKAEFESTLINIINEQDSFDEQI